MRLAACVGSVGDPTGHRMIRLAFVYTDEPHAGEIDLLAPLLGVAGFEIEAVRWDDPAVEWRRFEAVLIRQAPVASDRALLFGAWLHETLLATPVFNAPEVLRWNVDRSHMLEYQERGVRTPELVLSENVEDAKAKLAAFTASKVWVRPRAMWGRDAGPFPADSADTLAAVKDLLAVSQGVLLEGAVDADSDERIVFVAFNGRLSHAVRRTGADEKPYAPYSPSEELVLAADYALNVSYDIWEHKGFSDFAQVPLFGNLELAVVDGEATLLAVNFLHPDLFLDVHPFAAAKFFGAFLQQRNGFFSVRM